MKKQIDAPIAQLIRDLDERGLLDRTLVVLASEFSRDMMTEGKVGKEVKDQAINIPDVMQEPRHYGMHRHFTAAGSVLMFGGGVKKGFVYGKTADERPCTTIENPMPVEDLHATIYHALGIPPDIAYVVEKRPFYVTKDGKGKPVDGAVRMKATPTRVSRDAAVAAPVGRPHPARHAGQGRARRRRSSARRLQVRGDPRLGRAAAATSSGATPTTSSRTRRATSTFTTR